jgi:hypothetical protein
MKAKALSLIVAEFVNLCAELARKTGWREGEEDLIAFAKRIRKQPKQ